jgi:hypothetical protein
MFSQKTDYAIRCVVKNYNAGVVNHDQSVGFCRTAMFELLGTFYVSKVYAF